MGAQTSEDKRFYVTTRTGESIKLDKATVMKYLTDNEEISDSEYTMFFQLCKAHHVNPFLKECYIVKYKGSPATIVLDYKVLQQIAEDNKCFKGMKHGVLVVDKEGNLVERNGEYKLDGETLIGGWCEVYRSDRDHPTRVTAMFEEFKGVKKDGTLNQNWKLKPCFMICKVAKAQALREAFPNLVGSNIYISEEMDSVQKEPPRPAGNTTVTNSIADENEVVDVETGEVKETPTDVE